MCFSQCINFSILARFCICGSLRTRNCLLLLFAALLSPAMVGSSGLRNPFLPGLLSRRIPRLPCVHSIMCICFWALITSYIISLICLSFCPMSIYIPMGMRIMPALFILYLQCLAPDSVNFVHWMAGWMKSTNFIPYVSTLTFSLH